MTFISTCGHGYLKITLSQLISAMKLGFEPTSCSYQSGDSVLLEEDYDCSGFFRAMPNIDQSKIKNIQQDDIRHAQYNTIPLTLDAAEACLFAIKSYSSLKAGDLVTAFEKEYTVTGYQDKKLIGRDESFRTWAFPKNIVTKVSIQTVA